MRRIPLFAHICASRFGTTFPSACWRLLNKNRVEHEKEHARQAVCDVQHRLPSVGVVEHDARILPSKLQYHPQGSDERERFPGKSIMRPGLNPLWMYVPQLTFCSARSASLFGRRARSAEGTFRPQDILNAFCAAFTASSMCFRCPRRQQ